MLGLLVFALLQLQSGAQPEYSIEFERFGSDVIALRCRHDPSDQLVQINQTIRYWINITNGERPSGLETDLQRNLDNALIFPQDPSVAQVAFKITPELEGLYTCGRIDTENNIIAESESIYLTCE